MNLRFVPLAATLAAGTPAAADDAYRAEILEWREKRAARLAAPEGWLALVGLHWLSAGSQTIGSAADNDIVLAVGPERLGTVTLNDGVVTLTLAEGAVARIGDSDARSATLSPGGSTPATLLRMGEASFTVIQRGDKFGLRVRDPNAKTRTGFTGIDQFEIDPEWRFEARFEAHPPGRTIDIVNVLDMLEPMKNPGVVVFEKDGKEYRLEALDDTGDGQLFLIFADRTNGKLTYGPGRFLYAPAPVDGKTIVDFNRAYNPPCAFTPYSTCPLPPPENRLDLVVGVGEKKYLGGK